MLISRDNWEFYLGGFTYPGSIILEQDLGANKVFIYGSRVEKENWKVIFIVPISPISGKNASWMNFESTDQTDKIGW